MKLFTHNQRCEMLGDYFGLFANAARMKIFCCLKDGPRTVSQIAREVGITLPNTSQHLRLMRQRGAVTTMRSHRCVYYHLADIRFIQAADLIAQVLEERHPGSARCRIRRRSPGSLAAGLIGTSRN